MGVVCLRAVTQQADLKEEALTKAGSSNTRHHQQVKQRKDYSRQLADHEHASEDESY